MNEVIDVDAPQQAVAIRPSMAVGQAMSVDDIVAQVTLIQNVMHRVMREGEHYGTIPGCGTKKTLLQPGAQKLTMTFRLAPSYEIQEVNLERGHKEYRVICTLKSIQSATLVGQGVGCCSSMESKYRWRGGARKCPNCGKEAIIKGKPEYGGGWLCFAKKGGCGAKWDDGAEVIEGQSIDRVENDNPADTFNTVLKMAKKRAFVDATITATAASDIFTQDVGDDEGSVSDDSPPPTIQAKKAPQSGPAAQSKPKPTESKPKTTDAPQMPTEATRKWALGEVEKAGLLEYLPEWLEAAGIIMPNENLEDWPLMWVPSSKEQMASVITKVRAFSQGDKAEKPFTPHGVTAIEVPRDEPAEEQIEIDPAWAIIEGKISTVSLKEGKSAKGPWSLWGIKIGEDWFNTFNNTIGHVAQAAKKDGREVKLFYTVNEERNQNEAQHII